MLKPKIMFASLRDNRGTVAVETALIFVFMLLVSFGIIEMGSAYWQWTSAEKATQAGARTAITTGFVAHGLMSFPASVTTNGVSNVGTPCYDPSASGSNFILAACNIKPVVCTATAFTVSNGVYTVADGQGSCTPNSICDNGGGGSNCVTANFRGASFSTIVNAMSHLDGFISPTNVVVTYYPTQLGFVGRPGGLPLFVTVTLTGMKFKFYVLGVLAGISEKFSMPPFTTTLTGEVLCTNTDSASGNCKDT